MNPDSSKRTLISSVIGLIMLILFILTIPAVHYEPRGLLLPAKTVRPLTNASNVVLFAAPPAQFTKLGMVHIARFYEPDNTSKSEQEIINLAKQKAAQVGANGIVVKLFAHSFASMTPAPLGMYSFQGIAVYTSDLPAMKIPVMGMSTPLYLTQGGVS